MAAKDGSRASKKKAKGRTKTAKQAQETKPAVNEFEQEGMGIASKE